MNFDSDSNVVDVAVRRLRRKMDDRFAIKLIHTMRGMGMSSNGADIQTPRGRRRWSMAASLTSYYTLSVFILLAAASFFLYWGLERSFDRDNRDRLTQKIQVLTRLLQKQPFDRAGIEQEVSEEAQISVDSQSPFYLRILDHRQRLFAETPGMTRTMPPSVFPQRDTMQQLEYRWRSSDLSTYSLAARVVPGPSSSSQTWTIQAALNINAGERLLASYRRDIMFVLLGGLLVAAPIGVIIVRRGLRPIADITRATEGIGAQQLQHRINAENWPQELLTLATAFDSMLDRLQDSFERLSQFSADLAHELRTPITNLMGEGQVALSRDRTVTEYTRLLQSALEEHTRLARMIDSMLFLAQADQARSVLSPADLDARAEMEAVADFYQALAEEQGVQLVCEGEGHVAADSQLLRRAISNLLSNALKYTTRGGGITLRVHAAPDDAVVLSVIDSGTGIASQHLQKLGDRFYRVDPSRANSSSARDWDCPL